MKVSEIMHKLLKCDENLELYKAIDIMVKYDRGSLIIMKGNIPVGIFTERDALRLLAARKNTEDLKIKNVMSPLLYMADEDMPISEAARLMDEKEVRRLPVMDKTGMLIGMVTAASIAKSRKFMMARSLSSGFNPENIYA